MSEKSKLVEARTDEGAESGIQDTAALLTEAADGEASGEEQTEPANVDDVASSTAAKKRKSMKKRAKSLLAGKNTSPVIGESSSDSNKLPSAVMGKSNPSLQSEVRGMGKEKAE